MDPWQSTPVLGIDFLWWPPPPPLPPAVAACPLLADRAMAEMTMAEECWVIRTFSAAAVPEEEEVTTLGPALVTHQLKTKLIFNVSTLREHLGGLDKGPAWNTHLSLFQICPCRRGKDQIPAWAFRLSFLAAFQSLWDRNSTEMILKLPECDNQPIGALN